MSKPFIQPYLYFGGRCEEAIEFYRTAIGAEVLFKMNFNESPEPPPPGVLKPGFEKKVMHASMRIGESVIMASDGSGNDKPMCGFSLSLTTPNESDAKRFFASLSEGGNVTMPLGKTFWSPCFGMLVDKFGVGWMVTVPQAM